MDGKRLATAIAFMIAPISFLAAQEKGGPTTQGDLEAIKAELRSQDDRINRLSGEVTRLVEALKDKGIVIDKSTAAAPKASLAPKAAPASPSPTVPGTVGVDNPSPTAVGGVRNHVVAKGETLIQIAKEYGVTVEDIEQLNKITDAKKLQIGQTLKIPGSGSSASPSPSEQE
ncbi:MAG TPA: LysM peptidoglycan-binding domain-containing protein [Chthoniobacterales bacterium]